MHDDDVMRHVIDEQDEQQQMCYKRINGLYLDVNTTASEEAATITQN